MVIVSLEDYIKASDALSQMPYKRWKLEGFEEICDTYQFQESDRAEKEFRKGTKYSLFAVTLLESAILLSMLYR